MYHQQTIWDLKLNYQVNLLYICILKKVAAQELNIKEGTLKIPWGTMKIPWRILIESWQVYENRIMIFCCFILSRYSCCRLFQQSHNIFFSLSFDFFKSWRFGVVHIRFSLPVFCAKWNNWGFCFSVVLKFIQSYSKFLFYLKIGLHVWKELLVFLWPWKLPSITSFCTCVCIDKVVL